ncbi:MAG: tetratricopeptide repeat protein [Acidobacteriota bacterium]
MALNQSRTVGVIAAMLCGVIMPAGAQSAPAVTDRRITAARELENSGQLDAARQLYREIVASTAPTEAIPEALLSLARLAWPVDDPARLGREPVPQGLALEARTQLETLRVKYDRTPQAAEALWRLALLELEPSSPYYDPVDAAAQLRTLTVIAPDSPRVPAALVLAAETESRNGRLTQAARIALDVVRPSGTEDSSRAWQARPMQILPRHATVRRWSALGALRTAMVLPHRRCVRA